MALLFSVIQPCFTTFSGATSKRMFINTRTDCLCPHASCLLLSNAGISGVHLILARVFSFTCTKGYLSNTLTGDGIQGEAFSRMKKDLGANIPKVRFSTRVWWRSGCPPWWQWIVCCGGLRSFQLSLTPLWGHSGSSYPNVSYSAFPRKMSILFAHRHWAWMAMWPL